MDHPLVIVDAAQMRQILANEKTAHVFFRDFCKEKFSIGDILMPALPGQPPIGAYELTEVRECPLLELTFDEARAAGYPLWATMIDALHGEYPALQLDTMMILIAWKPFADPYRDERDQT